MTCVAHASQTSLRVALVTSGLEPDLSVSSLSNLFIREVSFIFLGHFGPNLWPSILGVFLGRPPQGIQAQYHLRYVSGFEQIRSLENFFIWNSVLSDGGEEGLNVLHQEEGRALFFELLDTAWLDLVDELTEDNSILENIFKFPGWLWLWPKGSKTSYKT